MAQKPTNKRKKTIPRNSKEVVFESDGEYLLKLVISVLFGTFWLKFGEPLLIGGAPIFALPVGVFTGLLLVHQFEKHQSDRKIWYAVIIIVGIISYFMPAGIVI